jgi:Rieske Fe-S protein
MLHGIKPTCGHMGCVVRWNDAEESWDCPCHGSRYGIDGHMLNAPTTKDLATVDVNVERPA